MTLYIKDFLTILIKAIALTLIACICIFIMIGAVKYTTEFFYPPATINFLEPIK